MNNQRILLFVKLVYCKLPIATCNNGGMSQRYCDGSKILGNMKHA